MITSRAARFSEIESRLRRLLGDERVVQVDFLLCLEEFDRVKGYEDLGYATLWDYCRRKLGLLDCAIARRVQSMRILRRFPVAEGYLRDGRLCMTGIGMLEKVLTAGNHVEMLDRASRKSTPEIAKIAVESNAPVPEKATLRKLPEVAREMAARQFPMPGAPPLAPAAPSANPTPTPTPTPTPSPSPSPVPVRPKQRAVQVSPRQYKLTLVVGEEFKAKLDRVKKILSHRVPDGNLEAVLSGALDLVIAKDDKRRGPPAVRKTAAKKETAEGSRAKSGVIAGGEERGADNALRKRAEVAALDSNVAESWTVEGVSASEVATVSESRPVREYIPVDVMRALWERDGGKCCWELANGEKCGSEFQVQPDHKTPVALGGRSVLSNLRLLCRSHNLLAARRTFGEAFMAKFRKRA